MKRTVITLITGLCLLFDASCEHECNQNAALCGDLKLPSVTWIKGMNYPIDLSIPNRTNQVPYEVHLNQQKNDKSISIDYHNALVDDEFNLKLNYQIESNDLDRFDSGPATFLAETTKPYLTDKVSFDVSIVPTINFTGTPINYQFSISGMGMDSFITPNWLGIQDQSLWSLQDGQNSSSVPGKQIRQLKISAPPNPSLNIQSMTLLSQFYGSSLVSLMNGQQLVAQPDVYMSPKNYNVFVCTLGTQSTSSSSCMSTQSVMGQMLSLFVGDPSSNRFVTALDGGALKLHTIQGTQLMDGNIGGISSPPKAIAATFAKFDADANLDFILINQDGIASVFLSQPNGDLMYEPNLTTSLAFLSNRNISALACADIDGNTQTDLIIAHDGQISFIFNIGSATQPLFLENTNLKITTNFPKVDALAVGDLTGDGLVDIAFANSSQNTLGVYTQIRGQ